MKFIFLVLFILTSCNDANNSNKKSYKVNNNFKTTEKKPLNDSVSLINDRSVFKLTNGFTVIVEEKTISLKFPNNEILLNQSIIRSRDENKTCMSDGFITVVNKGDFFTIEQQNCNNKKIINEYITFKYQNEDYLLHKLGFEFVDKSDQSNQETVIFTTKDFEVLLFPDVKLDSLYFELIQTAYEE